MLTDKEKKKREEEAMSIINSSNINETINNINFANMNGMKINARNDEEQNFINRVNEANNIINSINPRQDIAAPTVSEEDRIKSQQNAQAFLNLIDGGKKEQKQDNNTVQLNNEVQQENKKQEEQINQVENEELKRQLEEAKKQNVKPEQQELPSDMQSVKTNGMRLASSKETENAQKLSVEMKTLDKANKKNEAIKRGGVEAFNEKVDTILNNVLGATKQAAAGFANVATTIAGFGVKGLESLSKIAGLDNTSESLNNAYNSIVEAGGNINDKANEERAITGQIEDPYTKTAGNVVNVITNMIANQAIGFAFGINGTVAQGLSVGGSSAQEVLDKNKDNIGQATVTGIAKGYTSYLTERMFDANILTRGIKKTSIEKGINKLISNRISSSLGKELAHKTVGIIGENIEELVEDNAGYLIDKLINNEETPGFDQWLKNTTETGVITTLSTFIMGLLGLGGGSFKDIEMDMETEYWLDQAQQIIDREGLAIHFDPSQVKSTNTLQEFYTTKFNNDGELESVTPTIGKAIDNPNKELNVTPVVVRDSQTDSYNVIDGNTGVVLDSIPYSTTVEAQNAFNEKVNNLTDLQVKDINNKVSTAEYTLTNNIMSMIDEARTQISTRESVENANKTIDTNQTTSEQNTGDLNNEATSYTPKTVKSITDKFNTQSDYTKNEMATIWNNEVDAKDLNVVFDKNGNIQSYIAIEEDGNNLKVSQYDNNDNIIQSETILAQDGKYNTEAINNAIEKVTGVYKENNANKTPQKSTFYNNKTNYEISNIKEIEKGFGKNKTYTIEEVSDIWDNIMEDTYDLTLEDNNYVWLDEKNGRLEAVLHDGSTDDSLDDIIDSIEIKQNKDGKYSSKDIVDAVKKVATIIDENKPIKGQVDIEGNEVRFMKNNKKIERGNNNVRTNNSQQETNRAEEKKNTRGEKEISRSNGSNQEKLSRSLQQFQEEQQKTLGKDFRITLTEESNLTNTEKVIQNEFKNITGLDYGVYESNKGTSEGAVYVNDSILVKHNSLQSKKKSNFLPFHELGHWFKTNRKTEWNKVHDIIDNTITKNQIEQYKNVLKDTSMFDNMSEAEIREYIIEEIESDYFGNWANDISNWVDMIRNKTLSNEYVQLLMDISDENYSTHYNIFGTQEQQEQVYEQINVMISKFVAENKNNTNNIKYSARNNEIKRTFETEINQYKKSGTKNKTKNNIAYIYNNILDGLSKKKQIKMLNEFLKYEVKGSDYYVDGQKIIANNTTIGKLAKGKTLFDKRIPTDIRNELKANIIGNLDIVIPTSVIYQADRIDTNNHTFADTFDRRKAIVNYKNQNYEIMFEVGKKDGLNTLYGIENIKKTNKKSLSSPKLATKSGLQNTVKVGGSTKLTNSITQKSKSVKSNNTKTSKNNTIKKSNRTDIITTDSEGRTLTKEQQRFYEGNDIIDENGNLQVTYHGTPFGKFTKFNDKNLYFFSVDEKFAEDYAYQKSFEQQLDGDIEVMKVYLKAKNVFDPSKEEHIQKLREALPEQIRFWATTFDKETFLKRLQRIDDIPSKWTKEQIKNAKFGHVIGDDHYGYNNDIFIGVNKNNEVVYAQHAYGQILEHLTSKEQEQAKEKLLNGEQYSETLYNTPFGQLTEDAIRERISQLREQDKHYLTDILKYIEDGKYYMTDYSTYTVSPYTASQEPEHLTDIDNWQYIEGSNAWDNNEVGKDVIDIIKDLGYDGLKIYEKGKLNYAVFNKNQIKNVDNTKPTSDPDIRYSNRYDTEENGEGGFYSQLENVIEQKMPNTSNAQQIRGILNNSGVKQDELKWIGLDDYLKQHSLEKISKEQIQEYIKANQINIETVKRSRTKLDELSEPIKEDISNIKEEISPILKMYRIKHDGFDLTPFRPDGSVIGTIGDYMPEGLIKLVDLENKDLFEKEIKDGKTSYFTMYMSQWRNNIKRVYRRKIKTRYGKVV